MQLRNFVIAGVATLAAAGTLALTAAPSQAMTGNFVTFVTGNSSSTTVTYTANTGLAFTPTPLAGQSFGQGSGFVNSFITFGTTVATVGPATVTGNNITQNLGGTTFTIRNAANQDLLTGSFGSSTLSGQSTAGNASGAASATFNAQGVVYTSGQYLAEAGGTGGNIGDFGLSFSGLVTGFTVTAGSLDTFRVGGSGINGSTTGNFNVVVSGVPEPSEWAVIGMASLTLGGLMVRARRKGGMGVSAA